MEAVSVALLEGRTLRLTMVGEDDDLVRTRCVAAGVPSKCGNWTSSLRRASSVSARRRHATGSTRQSGEGRAHDAWVIARRGLTHMRRQPEQLSDATIQPIMFVLLFAYVFGGAIPIPQGNYREYLMGGIFAQTIVFTCFGVALALANDRKNNAVDRFRSLPIAKGAVLGGHAIANVLKSVLPIVIMSLCGLIIGWRIRSGAMDAIGGYLLLLLFAFSMIWVGVLLGSMVKTPEGVMSIAFVVLFPLTFLASTFVPLTRANAEGEYVDTMPLRAAGDRRVEPGDDARQRRAHPVRQPGRRPGAEPAMVDPEPGAVHGAVGDRHRRRLRLPLKKSIGVSCYGVFRAGRSRSSAPMTLSPVLTTPGRGRPSRASGRTSLRRRGRRSRPEQPRRSFS